MQPTLTTPLLTHTELDALGASADAVLPAFLEDLARLVNVDCGSYTKTGVDTIGRWVAEEFQNLGGSVAVEPHPTLGDTVVGEFGGADPDGPTLLLIGHMDTVFDEGTAAQRPFRIDGGLAYGPGVTDMKGGLLTGLYALRVLRDALGGIPARRIVYVANPDEEIGSPTSSPIISRFARDADACLVLECARANGDIVSSRKGILDARVTIHGRAAHAGVEPEKGRNAIEEAARIVRDVHALNGRWPGVTLNVGVIRGGTRPNVVAEQCMLELDVRAVTAESQDAVTAEIRRIVEATVVPDVTVELETMATWRPMEKLERSGRLVEHAVELAGRLGFGLKDAATGGASDANTTSGLGVPTIDGLGPIGGNDHAPGEYLEVGSIVPRTTLLAALIATIGRDPDVRRWRGRGSTA
ncbi:MAG: M20 family metallopeptidase [Chloroflexota bacterium]